MKNHVLVIARPLAVLMAAFLFHNQIALADGCNIPMFGGARLFGAASGSQGFVMGDFNGDGYQ